MSIGPVSSASVAIAQPVPNVKAPGKSVAPPAPVTSAGTDADGDHDGSVGSKINVKA
jgi:hypothetical protein